MGFQPVCTALGRLRDYSLAPTHQRKGADQSETNESHLPKYPNKLFYKDWSDFLVCFSIGGPHILKIIYRRLQKPGFLIFLLILPVGALHWLQKSV